MNTQKGRTGHKGAQQENLQDRLIPFPVRNGFTGLYPDSKSDALWPILARNQRNPFVKFLRTVFYYSDHADDRVPAVAREGRPQNLAYFHGKTLAH